MRLVIVTGLYVIFSLLSGYILADWISSITTLQQLVNKHDGIVSALESYIQQEQANLNRLKK